MKYLYFFVLLSFGLSSCVKNNPLPVWLEINQWTLNSNPNSAMSPGALTHNFSDVWVYVDGKVIGVFEVPCKIPVLVSGNCKVQLFPAIRNNGLSVAKKIYPFAKAFETTLELNPGETYTFNPVTSYEANTHFDIEDFESSSLTLEKETVNSSPNLNLQIPTNGPWGNYGYLSLNTTDSLWIGLLPELTLPKSGAEVYLEFDYKNTSSILTGMIERQVSGNTVDHGGYTANKQSPDNLQWKKIYIDLKDVVSNTPNGIKYRQYLRMHLDAGLSSGEVSIDNIKVVHF
ncbi:hypothetical protein [Fluviicola sp.]|uniref:hypothetical protein n=1 Tax=Fluviicola sp. TaxID=1917219 RepID=UPI0031E04A30